MLKQRIITALILAPLALCGLFLLEPVPFAYFVGFVTILGAWEWANLAGYQAQFERCAYAVFIGLVLLVAEHVSAGLILGLAFAWWVFAFALILSYPKKLGIWKTNSARFLIGVFVLVPFWKALVFIRSSDVSLVPELSPLWVILYMLLLVWAADVGAYFAGKAWGNKKLAPSVSPGKSWAGAWGGLACVAALSLLASYLLSLNTESTLLLLLTSCFAGVVSVIGDLAESMFKRYRGIKDSSNLLPGHGGIMDRIDSLTAAIPVLLCLFILMGWMA